MANLKLTPTHKVLILIAVIGALATLGAAWINSRAKSATTSTPKFSVVNGGNTAAGPGGGATNNVTTITDNSVTVGDHSVAIGAGAKVNLSADTIILTGSSQRTLTADIQKQLLDLAKKHSTIVVSALANDPEASRFAYTIIEFLQKNQVNAGGVPTVYTNPFVGIRAELRGDVLHLTVGLQNNQ